MHILNLILLPLICGANIVDLDNYKLAEKVLQSKSRFVFSDFTNGQELKDAKAEFDFYMVPKNYKTEQDHEKLRMYVIMAESKEAKKIYTAIRDNMDHIDQVGIDYIIKQNVPESSLTFYKMVELEKQLNRANLDQNRFQATVKIKDEGVYYTYFMYEQVPVVREEDKQIQEDRHEDLYGPGGNRLLPPVTVKPSDKNVFDPKTSHYMIMTGSISFKNTDGYLSAEQKTFLSFYPIMTFIYFLMVALWCYDVKKHREHLIPVHFYVLSILWITFLECIFNVSYFSYNNRVGKSSHVLTFIACLIEVIRNTLSRVFTLVIGLGYGILITNIQKYQTKIMTLSFLYMVSLAAYSALQIINHHSQVSGSVALIISFPLSVLNSFFCVWIYFAFRRTLTYLKLKEQTFKYMIIFKLYMTICISLVISAALFVFELIQVVSDQRDANWESQWAWETGWFWIYTVFVFIVVVILRPNEKSDMLGQMQEVLDETLTEMPTEGEELDDSTIESGIEMNQFDVGSMDHNPTTDRDLSIGTGRSQQPQMTMEEFKELKRAQRAEKLKTQSDEIA